MYRILKILFIITGSLVLADTGSISGKVMGDSMPLAGANVYLKGTSMGATTDSLGSYLIENVSVGKYLIRADYIGYESSAIEIYVSASDVGSGDSGESSFSAKLGLEEDEDETADMVKGNQLVDINFNLLSSTVGLNEIVVSAAKKKQKITKAPATISTIREPSLRRQVGVNAFARLVSSLKGVDVSYYGVDGAQINARGFSGMFSSRFKQYNDGLDMAELFSNQLYTSIASPPKESISKIEVVFGPQSSLYGADASTGLLNIIHKDPRTNQDNEVNFSGSTVSTYRLGSRIARKVSDNFAWDIVAEASQAKEFDYGNTKTDAQGNYLNPVTWIDQDPITGLPDTLVLEEDYYGVMDQHKYYLRTNLFYTLRNGHHLKVSPMYLNAKGYTMGSMGAYYNKDYENLMVDVQYATDKHNLRYHFINQGTESIFREPLARFTAITGHGFDKALKIAGKGTISTDSLTWFNNYEGFGHLFDYQFNSTIKPANHPVNIVSGVDYEYLDPTSHRTMFEDNGWDYFRGEDVKDAKDVKESRYGAYFQLDTDINPTLSITGSVRYDAHKFFGEFISPKFAIVKEQFFNGSLKFMLGRGFKAPSLTERWVYTGTKNYVTGPGYSLDAIGMGNREGFTLRNYVDNNFSGIYDEGVDSLVVKRDVAPIRLEITNTAELSYSGLLKKNLIFEVGAYISEYENFKTAALHFATTGLWYFSADPTGPFPNQDSNPNPLPWDSTTWGNPPTMIEVVKGNGEVLPHNIIAITYTSLPVKTNVWGFETGFKYFSDRFDMDFNYTHFNDSDLKTKRDKGKRYQKYQQYYFAMMSDPDNIDPELMQYANDGDLYDYNDFVQVYSNTPNHQLNASITAYDVLIKDLSVGINTRAISEFEFKSGWFEATEDGDEKNPLPYRTTQTFFKDKGPIGGGFYSDVNISYQLKENYSIGFSVKNIFESDAISFPLSPKQPRYFMFETGYRF